MGFLTNDVPGQPPCLASVDNDSRVLLLPAREGWQSRLARDSAGLTRLLDEV